MKREKSPSFSRMTNRLESLIASGAYRVGDRLPSIRALGAEYGVNNNVVLRGLRYLQEKKLLAIRHGDGVYVASPPPLGEPLVHVAVLGIGEMLGTSYASMMLVGIQEEAARSGTVLDCNFNVHFMPGEERKRQAMQMIRHAAERNEAVIMLGSYDSVLEEIPSTVPVVGAEMHRNFGGLVSPVSLDPAMAAELAVEFFRERGIAEVAVPSVNYPVGRVRDRFFIDQWEGAIHAVASPEALKRLAGKKAGLFSSSTSELAFWAESYPGLYDDFTVLTEDGKSLLVPSFRPVNTISPDWREVGVAVLRETLRRLQEPGTGGRRLYLPVKLYKIEDL